MKKRNSKMKIRIEPHPKSFGFEPAMTEPLPLHAFIVADGKKVRLKYPPRIHLSDPPADLLFEP